MTDGTESERFSAQTDRRPSAVSRAVPAEEDAAAGWGRLLQGEMAGKLRQLH